MDELTSLPNIGDVLSQKLTTAGINNYDDLVNIGSVEALLKIGETDPTACYNMLYALEGAIRMIRWHSIPKEERQLLKKEFDRAIG